MHRHKKRRNSFDINEHDSEKLALINLSTGTVAPAVVCESLLTAREQGEKGMKELVQDSLVLGKTGFWEPFKNNNIKPFQSLKPLNSIKTSKLYKP